MAIRILTSQKDRDIIGNPTYELVDPAELERLTSIKHSKPEYFETTWVGCVLALGEHNYYDDSDFYAIVWDATEGKPREVQYATTRGWTYANSASVDATEEVLAAYREYTERQRREARERREAWEAVQPYVGRTVKVIKTFRSKGAKVAVGTVAEVKWYGEDKYQSETVRMIDPQFRIGFDVDGQRVFTSAKNVEVYTEVEVSAEEVAEVLEAIEDPARQANALRAAALESLRQLRENLIKAAVSSRTVRAEVALKVAADRVESASEYLERGVNGNANVQLDRAHKVLTPLCTRASRKAIADIKALGLL